MTAHLDGNVLAGPLAELFAGDITIAIGQCATCGARAELARAVVFADAPGLIANCPACGAILLRLVRAPGRAWLDLRGLACLQIAIPES
jgi:Family of unknown function (DUF6510)